MSCQIYTFGATITAAMGTATRGSGLLALHRLMSEAAAGPQAKVDALVAFAQRDVWVVLEEDGAYRTLVNEHGATALPVFTEEEALEQTAPFFHWDEVDGRVPRAQIAARSALEYQQSHSLDYVVVDIGTTHTIEIDSTEAGPLLTAQAKKSSQGPFAGVGRISSSMMQAVKPPSSKDLARPDSYRSAPPPIRRVRPSMPYGAAAGNSRKPDRDKDLGVSKPPLEELTEPLPLVALPPSVPPSRRPEATSDGLPPEPPVPRVTAVFGRPPTGPIPLTRSRLPPPGSTPLSHQPMPPPVRVLYPVQEEPSDVLIQGLADVLRSYPEVEWAAIGLRQRDAVQATVVFNVLGGFQERVRTIAQELRRVGEDQQFAFDVALADGAEGLRAIREQALLFYPWRR